jgi:hypothetical protein
MSQRPAYNLIGYLSRLKLTNEEYNELINNCEELKATLTLGINSIGDLMSIAASGDDELEIEQRTLRNISWLISTLADSLQGYDELYDRLKYFRDNSYHSGSQLEGTEQSEGEHDNAQHSQ